MAFNDQMSEIKRRSKARCIRALTQMDPPKTVDEAALAHNVSRTTAYRIVEELEAWEKTATYQDEADEILAQTKRATYDPYLWLLTSSKMLMAYSQGHDGVGPELFGGSPEPNEVIGTDDPLCE